MTLLTAGLSCMAPVAQRLPVGFGPEQLLVSVVRDNVIGLRGGPQAVVLAALGAPHVLGA